MLPDWLKNGWEDILHIISGIKIQDCIDIFCVSIILFCVYKFVRERRAGKLALGVLLVFLIQLASNLFDMYLLQFLLQNIFQVGIILLVILFQPELRSFLEKMGGQSIKGFRGIGEAKNSQETLHMIDEVVSAVMDMSESKTGALIVFERGTRLGDLILTGTVINADPVDFLIKNIFFNKAPLHDGALIVRANRLYAAGCLLPLSVNPDIIKDLGTRHRAAIGMSENSDAVVVVVSEETGVVSIALEGAFTRGFNKETLTDALRRYLITDAENGVQRAKRTWRELIGSKFLNARREQDKNK